MCHFPFRYDCGCEGRERPLCPEHNRPIMKAGVVFEPVPLSHSWPRLGETPTGAAVPTITLPGLDAEE